EVVDIVAGLARAAVGMQHTAVRVKDVLLVIGDQNPIGLGIGYGVHPIRSFQADASLPSQAFALTQPACGFRRHARPASAATGGTWRPFLCPRWWRGSCRPWR